MIALKSVFKNFQLGEEEIKVLDGINLNVAAGELVAVSGPSGSGKTTLLNLIAGLDSPSQGDVLVNEYNLNQLKDKDLSKFRNDHIGFVFQMFNLEPKLTALENVALPLLFSDLSKEARLEKAYLALEIVGLLDRLRHKPDQLSGGQRQKVAIARALVNEPAIILADEPTGNLDRKNSQDILYLLKMLNNELGVTVMVVTHDEEAAKIADRCLRLDKGVLME